MDRNTSWGDLVGCYSRQARPQEVFDASYLALVALASHPAVLGPGLHPARQTAFRPVGHWPGPQRRGAYRHPVAGRPGPRPRLEGPGVVRRIWFLEPVVAPVGYRAPAGPPAQPQLVWLPRLG